MKVAVIKAECHPDFKNRVSEFVKKKGETESSIIRKAVLNYIKQEEKK